jgi:hypothetical protein
MAHIAPQFWDDDKIFELGPAGVLVFSCMIAGPQITNLPGIYRAEPKSFHHPVRCYPPEEVESAFNAIVAQGMAIYDPVAKVVRLPKVYRYHSKKSRPRSPMPDILAESHVIPIQGTTG